MLSTPISSPIKYFNTVPDQNAGKVDDLDNPRSPAFVPLDQRGEAGKARWWALYGTKKPKHVVQMG